MSPRVALITGAARGIGAATAHRLAADGWRLVLFDRCADDPAVPYALATPAELDGVVADCVAVSGDPSSALAVVGDVRDLDALRGAVASADEIHGGLDAVVAAAGIIAGGPPAWELDNATWDVLVDINLLGVLNLARAAVPALLARPQPRTGRFVAVASAAGLVGMPRLAGYNAAKHGVVGLVKGLAADLGPSGVTANAVCPGSTMTEMLAASADVYELTGTAEFALHHLSGRLLEPAEIAELVAWLCSPSSSALTGAILPADSGMTAR